MSHILTWVESIVAMRDGLPAENLTRRGQLSNPLRVACSVPVSKSQMQIFSSSEAEARSRPSVENAHERTQSVCLPTMSELPGSTAGAKLSHENPVRRSSLRLFPSPGQNRRLFLGEIWGGLWVY